MYNSKKPELRWERKSTETGGIIKLFINNATPLEVNSYFVDTSDSKRYYNTKHKVKFKAKYALFYFKDEISVQLLSTKIIQISIYLMVKSFFVV